MKAVISKTLAKILANAESRHHLGKLLANGDYEGCIEIDGQRYRLRRIEGSLSSQKHIQQLEKNAKQIN